MEFKGSCGVLFAAFIHLLVLNCAQTSGAHSDDVSANDDEAVSKIGWLFSNRADISTRVKRAPHSLQEAGLLSEVKLKCSMNLHHLCGDIYQDDELRLLECVQTLKPNEAASIDTDCHHAIWNYIMNITNNYNIQRLAQNSCGSDMALFKDCAESEGQHGTYLLCLIDNRREVKAPRCIEFIQRLEWIAFSNFRIITSFNTDCERDIAKLKCDKAQPHRDISQGQVLACLQESVHDLYPKCMQHVFRVSELQADNVRYDRQLFMACANDHIRFCPNIRPGSGQVYKCLMQHKIDRSMTAQCEEQLTRREKIIASDYKASKGLVKACREDIKNNHCKRSVSNDDKVIRLAQILLCLEAAVKNGSNIGGNCQAEMFDHRKLLMEDYRLSPEIVNGCAQDIITFCNSPEVGGVTIHCLMEHTRPKKKRPNISSTCRRALEELIKEADAGEDWRIDPILREQCEPVVKEACTNVHGGDARVISCLLEQLRTERMTEPCEAALIQLQYFIVRDFKLDPQLYKACKSDAVRLCHAKTSWSNNGRDMDPERGPLILTCLYRHAYHPQKNMTLKEGCMEEIRRVMRQRAVNVDLQPEIEEVCLNELALLCYDKTAKGEEILCLQDNLEGLGKPCKLAVGNFTEEQAERIELNPIISAACQRVMDRYCDQVLKYGKDEGDMMECLIEHKPDMDARSDNKCKAAVEHFQLISLKNYHFTYKFKEACRPYVKRWCPKSKTKADVIECLSTIVQDDIMDGTQHRIPKDCRQQLKAQLYQQRENIQFDPVLHSRCAKDIKEFCFNVEEGNSQVLECLASKKSKLSDECHKQLFKVRKQEFQDSSVDFVLLNTCNLMIKQFCHKTSQALDCLKKYKNDLRFDEKCKNVVIKRMIEQNTDYRFNTALQVACHTEINKHCKMVLINEPVDKELEGKVISCLKIKFRESKLKDQCEEEMTKILREANLNYQLNPLLVQMCGNEIEKICRADESDPGAVQECLKLEFNAGNKDMTAGCRSEVAALIEQTRADIHVDPILQKACAIDVSKYCSDIPRGAGRHITCLQNVLEDSNKALEPDCHKMLTTRMEMFRHADKIIAPKTIEELYSSVSHSPARRYFMIVAFTMIGVIFIIGLFCGRVTRRTMLMKNK